MCIYTVFVAPMICRILECKATRRCTVFVFVGSKFVWTGTSSRRPVDSGKCRDQCLNPTAAHVSQSSSIPVACGGMCSLSLSLSQLLDLLIIVSTSTVRILVEQCLQASLEFAVLTVNLRPLYSWGYVHNYKAYIYLFIRMCTCILVHVYMYNMYTIAHIVFVLLFCCCPNSLVVYTCTKYTKNDADIV